jgi:hypothetical protein
METCENGHAKRRSRTYCLGPGPTRFIRAESARPVTYLVTPRASTWIVYRPSEKPTPLPTSRFVSSKYSVSSNQHTSVQMPRGSFPVVARRDK